MRVRVASASEVRPLLQRAMRYATTAETLDDLIDGSMCMVALDDGVPVAGWVQEFDQYGVLNILAYGGTAEIDLTVALERWIRRLNVTAARFRTCRPGLVKKAEKLGYRVIRRDAGGVVMRKEYR
jgi:hypothetical protein